MHVDGLYVSLAVLAGLLVVLAPVARPLRGRLWVSEPLLALALGIATGPQGLGWIDPARWRAPELILEEAMRVTLAVALMGVALRLPREYVRRGWRTPASMVLLLMPAMALVTAALAWRLLDLPLWQALALGACVAPTDPVAASAIVQGPEAERALPAGLRRALSAESGANDGLALALVRLPLLALAAAEVPWAEWLGRVWLREIGGGVLLGAALGWAAGRAYRAGDERGWTSGASGLEFTAALSILVLAVGRILRLDGLLAVFACGLAFSETVAASEQKRESEAQEAEARLLLLPAFTLFGVTLPWAEWVSLGWKGPALAATVLLLRRLPAVLLLRRAFPDLRRTGDALFGGWFGPIGLSAVFYLSLARREGVHPEVWVAGTLIVGASVLAHGATATPFTKLYARRRSR